MKAYLIFLTIPLLAMLAWWGGGSLGVPEEPTPPVLATSLELPEGLEQAQSAQRAPTPQIDLAAFQPSPSAYRRTGSDSAQQTATAAEGEGEEEEKMILPAAERLVLSGIMAEDELRIARLGGSIVRVGDRVKDYRVVRINLDSVIVDGPLGREEVGFRNLPLENPEPAEEEPSPDAEREGGSQEMEGLRELRELHEQLKTLQGRAAGWNLQRNYAGRQGAEG